MVLNNKSELNHKLTFFPFLFLVICSSNLYAQQQAKSNPRTLIGAVKGSKKLIAELYYVVKSPGDTTYVILYNNYEYKNTTYKFVTFKGTTQTIDTLYNQMKAVFKPENEKNKNYSMSLKLGEENVRLGLTRSKRATSLIFYGKTGYVYLTEKQVDKLFGRS